MIPLYRKFRVARNGRIERSNKHEYWSCFDDDVLPSLEEVLQQLPIDLSLNLEIKMVTLPSMAHTPSYEIERMTQPTIDVLSRFSKRNEGRQILLSSFDPDICTTLTEKLKKASLNIPVMFLTEGGASEHADPRRMTIEAAIDFCHSNGLIGFVVNSARLQSNLHLMEHAHKFHLKVMTYGTENNNMDWIREQSSNGIHGAIVDDISTILLNFVHEPKQS